MGERDAQALDEYQEQMLRNPRTTIEKLPVTESPDDTPSLLDIRRREKAVLEASRDEQHLKRFRIVDYTSEDSDIKQAGLKSYYCSICGSHLLVTDTNLVGLPRRTTDAAVALQTGKHFRKTYLAKHDTLYLNRGMGVETQHRWRCQDCDYPVAYTTTDSVDNAP